MSESNAKEKEVEILRKQVIHETNILNGYNNDIEKYTWLNNKQAII